MLAEKPISPSKPLVVVATLLLAIAGTIGLVLASERWEHLMRSVGFTANGKPSTPRIGIRRRSVQPQTLPQVQPPA
jgi:hypothetical protein